MRPVYHIEHGTVDILLRILEKIGDSPFAAVLAAILTSGEGCPIPVKHLQCFVHLRERFLCLLIILDSGAGTEPSNDRSMSALHRQNIPPRATDTPSTAHLHRCPIST